MTQATLAETEPIRRIAGVLNEHRIETIIVDTADEARAAVLALIPDGAEVHSGKSKTLEDVGLYAELIESGRYDAIRPRLFKMDRQTQGAEMRRLVAAPDRKSPVEDGALGKAFGLQCSLRVNFFVDARHRDEEGRPHLLHGRRQAVEEGAIGQGNAVIEHGEIDVTRGDVAKRKK